jgi:hypothetical protein
MASVMISRGEARRAAGREPADIRIGDRPVTGDRPPWFTRMTLGAVEAERDTRAQRRAAHEGPGPSTHYVARARFPRLAAAYAGEAPTVAPVGRNGDDGGSIEPTARSLPAEGSSASDRDRDRFAIRRLLTELSGEEQRLERLGRAFDADEQHTKDVIESTWRTEHWGRAPTRLPSWRTDANRQRQG